VHFGDLDFIVTAEEELARAPVVIQPLHSAGLNAITKALEELQLHAPEARASGSDQLLGFDYGRIELQLGTFLGPRPSREDLCRLTFLFANIMTQLAGGEPLSLEYLIRSAPTGLPFVLCNAAETVGHLVAQHTPSSPTNDEFMGITKYIMESFYDLLTGESELSSNSDSSRGSHHPSRECFMVGTPKGYVESIHKGGATPIDDLDDEVKGDVGAPPRLWVEQLRAWHQELEEAQLQLEQEHAALERHEDGGRARDVACDMNRGIIEYDKALPYFTWTS